MTPSPCHRVWVEYPPFSSPGRPAEQQFTLLLDRRSSERPDSTSRRFKSSASSHPRQPSDQSDSKNYRVVTSRFTCSTASNQLILTAMEAFAFPGDISATVPLDESTASTGSVSLPPSVHKRQLSSTTGSPVKRRKLSEPVSSPGSPMSTSSVGSMTPSSSKSGSSRPNMTASSSITLDMLRPHFEEPLAKVAASFGICVTLLKKICRRHGIARWPHRQITGLRKSIASMEHAIGYFDGDRRESYAEQLLKQKNKLAALLEDPTTNNPLLADEGDKITRRHVKVPSVQSTDNGYEAAPALMTRASSPTGPLLAESPYYGATSVVMPTQTSPMWLPAPHYAELNYTQKYHQLCPPPKFEQPRPEIYSATSYYAPSAVPVSTNVSSPTIHLPPLRREARAVLPPISSLVVGNPNSINSLTPMSSW